MNTVGVRALWMEQAALGLDARDVEKDAEGIETMNVSGQNMAWLTKKLYP